MSAAGRSPRMARQAGFTLLEVLVATVVLGFLLAGLAEGTRFGLRAWATQTRVIDRRATLDAVDRTLRGLIGGMDPGFRVDPPNIRGTAHGLAFTAPLPQGAALAAMALRDAATTPEGAQGAALDVGVGQRRADMLLVVDAAHRLVLRWTPALHVRQLLPPRAHETVLLEGVAEIDLAYWRDTGGGAWLGSWEGRAPPTLVRLRIVHEGGEAWPVLVVAPRRSVADD